MESYVRSNRKVKAVPACVCDNTKKNKVAYGALLFLFFLVKSLVVVKKLAVTYS